MDTTLSILALESKHSLDLSVIMSLQRSHHKEKHEELSLPKWLGLLKIRVHNC